MSDTHGTTHTSAASITLRGKTVFFRPLTLTHVGMAYDDLLVIRECTDVLAPDVFPHFLKFQAPTALAAEMSSGHVRPFGQSRMQPRPAHLATHG